MIFRKKYYCCLSIIISIFFTAITYSQELNDNDLIVYPAPSSKFHNIVLQNHKGLPRFGLLNNYSIPVKNNNGYKKHSKIRQNPATREKNKKIQLGYQNYFKMVTFKYLSEIYKDIDKERLTKTSSSNITKKQENSRTAQSNLALLSRSICVEEKCKNGFSGVNEFERLRNYKSFVKDNLDDLRTWSNSFFKNNNVIGYHVSSLGLGSQSYDFDKNGYWVFLNLNINVANNRITYTSFEPKAQYENNLVNKSGSHPNRTKALQIFLPMSPEKAEKFQLKNIRSLYIVKKIRVNPKEVKDKYNSILNLVYYHESPLLEIYEDMALTKKIGTLSLDRLILKEL